MHVEHGFGLLKPTQTGVIILSSSGKVLACNRNAEAWLGITIGDDAPNELIDVGDRIFHSGSQESMLLKIPGMDDLMHVVSSPLSIQETTNGVLIQFWSAETDKTTLSNFQHDMAHALRNPLRFIQLYLDLIGRVEEESKREPYLSGMRQQAHHLQAIIDDLIYLMGMTTSPLKLESLGARLLAEEAISSVYSLVEDSGINLRLRDEPDLPLIRADRKTLEVAIRHLLTRAIRISETDAEVEIRLAHQTEGVEVIIRDHAPTFQPHELPRIFDPFYTGDLNLTIVKRILDKHGVDIDITSESGVGTSFSFSLPAA